MKRCRQTRVWVVLVGWLWLAGWTSAAEVGGLRGRVLDQDDAAPLSQARVSVVEALLSALTTPEGQFSFDQVPPGVYTVAVAKEGYERKVLPNVVVTAGQFTDLSLELDQSVYEMEELVVRGFDMGGGTEQGLLNLRELNSGLQDAISAELFSKAGASTAKDALKLVVGTSIQDDKYAVIRGLSDRYVGTLLDQMRVPSPDPEKRAVQLDIFPAGTIESITVHKTFTPDLQGDFSGGGVSIQTKNIPTKPIVTAAVSLEYNTQATGNDDFLGYQGGGTGFAGIAGAERDLPAGADKQVFPSYLGASTTADPLRQANAEQIDQLTKAFAPAMGVKRTGAPPPNYGFQAFVGDRLQLTEQQVMGVYGGLTYRRKYSHSEGRSNRYTISGEGQQPNETASFEDTRSAEEVLWGAVAGVEWQPDRDHKLGLKLLYNQSAKDLARFQIDPEAGTTAGGFAVHELSQTLHYTERRLGMAQLYGVHGFSAPWAPRVDWFGALGVAAQDEPDVRFFRNVSETDGALGPRSSFVGQTDEQNTLRVWRNIEEIDRQAALNLRWPFRQWTDTEGLVKLGGFHDEINRDYDQQSFTYRFASQAGPSTNPARRYNLQFVRNYYGPDLWTEVFTDTGRIGLATNAPPAPNQLLYYLQPTRKDTDYEGNQTIQAGYLMGELPVSSWLRFSGGARLEQTSLSIDITTQDGTALLVQRLPTGNYGLVALPDAQAGTNVEQLDILPAVGLVWQVRPRLYFKANWSQTIARPTFRELAPVATVEFLGDDSFIGNPSLQISQVQNYDLRLEWFRRAGDVLAVSAFYKQIQDPIERINLRISDARYIQPVNYDQGRILGLEIEARQRLDLLHPWLRHFSIGANASWIDSEVEVPATERAALADFGLDSATRPMQGQPDYLANLYLLWNCEPTGTSAGLFYTYTGRLLLAGAGAVLDAVPNLYEEPYSTLNFSLEQKLGKHWSAKFQAKNLLNPVIQRRYELPWDSVEMIHTEYRKGIDFSLGVSCSW